MDLKEKQEIINLAIASFIMDENYIKYKIDYDKVNTIIISPKDKEAVALEVPDFSSFIESDDLNLFKYEYKNFLIKVNNIYYGNDINVYEENELERIEDINNITDILGRDHIGRLIPQECEYVNTTCFLSEQVSEYFWCHGGIEELENQLEEECPDVIVAHYKGKAFYVYEYMSNDDIRSFCYMTLEDFDEFIECEEDVESFTKSDYVSLIKYYIDERQCDEYYVSEKSSNIEQQMQRAVKIIEVTRDNLKYETAIDTIIYEGSDNYIDSIYKLTNESNIASQSLLDNIFEDIKDSLYCIPEMDIDLFIHRPFNYFDKHFYDNYIKNGKFKFNVYKYNREKCEKEIRYTFEYDFIEVSKNYIKNHYTENYELRFDDAYSCYTLVNLDSVDDFGYHIGNAELVFKTEEAIAKAISMLNRRTYSNDRRKELLKEAVEKADLFNIKIEDSYNSGNCVTGTKKFCKLFNLPTDTKSEVSASDFLNYINESSSNYKMYAENALIKAYERYLKEANI